MNLSDDVNSSLINIAGDYFMLNKPDSAWYYMNTALEQARRFDRKNLVENAYRHIYSYYLRKGDYKEAVTYYKRYSIIGDSILMERNTGNIRVIEANQRILRIGESNSLLAKQNQVQALNARNQRFQVIFMQGLTFLAALLVFTFLSRYLFNLYSRRKMQRLNITLSSEINERERAQEQLEQREKQYRFLADHSIDLITRIDKKFKFTYASPSSSRILGYTPEEMVALRTYDMTQADYHGYAESVVGTMLKTQMSKQAIYPAIKKNGSIFWAESVLNPIFDQVTGEFREIVAVTRDIQERKIKEIEIMDGTKQKENLLKEIHHRVKNNFAILVSLINMQKDQTKNPELLQSLTNLQLRIRTMALVHEMLYRSKDFERISFPDYLRSVASVIAGTFNRRDIELVFDLQEATMDIEASIPLGLMINEILSNAFKHAFPGEKGGSIKVRLLNDPGSSNLFLSIEDDGIGLPEGFSIDNCKTMGLQIVQILVRQIEGQLTITSSGGTRFSISFPKAN
jgi:PAS domain S-box-containing protein